LGDIDAEHDGLAAAEQRKFDRDARLHLVTLFRAVGQEDIDAADPRPERDVRPALRRIVLVGEFREFLLVGGPGARRKLDGAFVDHEDIVRGVDSLLELIVGDKDPGHQPVAHILDQLSFCRTFVIGWKVGAGVIDGH